MPRHKFLVCLISVVIVGLQLSLQGAAISLPQNQKKKAPDSGAKAKSGQPKQERKDQGTDQNNEPSAGDSEEAGKDEAPERLLRERAKLILSLLSQEARQWEKKDVAAGLQAQVADLLWETDSAPARNILIYAWDTARDIKDKKQERSAYRNYSKRTEVMRKVLIVAKRRDESLAEKWIEEMAEEKKEEKQATEKNGQSGMFDDRSARSAVLLEAALALVKENPQTAASLAIDSLRDGISFGLQTVLIALQAESANLSERVFRAALNRLVTVGMSDPNEVLVLYSYLYTPGRIKAAETGDQQGRFSLAVGKSSAKIAPVAQLNPAMGAEFLRIAAGLLLNAPLPSTTPNPAITARVQISVINSLIGSLGQVAPDKAAALANRRQLLMADAQFSLSPPQPPAGGIEARRGESRAEYNERLVDTLEKQAESEVSPLGRDIAFAKAAVATEIEDCDRGWSLARKIQDRQFKSDVANWITFRATLHFIQKGNLAKAAELNNKNEDAAQRALCFVVGAQKLIAAKDNLRAENWLREAGVLMRKADPDQHWVKISLGVVAAQGKLDRIAALQVLRDAVNVMNKFPDDGIYVDKSPTLQRFSGIGAADLTYGAHGFGLDSALAVFRAEDFDGVFNALNDVESPEARGTAKLVLCRQILKSDSRQSEDRSKNPRNKQQPENSDPDKPEPNKRKG